MQIIHQQNQVLKKSIQEMLEQIQQQKELNHQHETQIQTLLKFNERLLSIIQKQINNKKDNMTLHPISERSERQSDLISNAMNQIIKNKRISVRSQRGKPSNSLINPKGINTASMIKNIRKSQLDKASIDPDDLSDQKIQQKTAYPIMKSVPKPIEPKISDIEKAAVKDEMNKEIKQLKKFKNQSMKFYDNKINEIKGLSDKLNKYKPMQQFKQISQKLSLSQNTTNLIRKAMQKNNKE